MLQRGWFLLVIGLIVGLVLGYVLAEQQRVPPAQAPAATAGMEGLPPGHPPVDQTAQAAGASDASRALARQADELEQLLAQSPDDARLMVALGNLYFDAARWNDARIWYERSLEKSAADANVLTDLAVVYRNLSQFDRSLELLDKAIALDPDHWQAWYNKVVVLHFDLHRHDEAVAAMKKLQAIKASNPDVPDLSSLEKEMSAN
jgi:tetratricopeptide (TPR) repeat protein